MNTRHLAAVMFTDIEGYTSLMQTDEAAALALRDRHREVFETAHKKFGGKIIQYFGDGTLSTFTSSRNAVDCAIEMQKAFLSKPKVPLRIGIHLGEITVSGDDIAGDTVNVASRVESLGVPGSILVSAKVFDDVKNLRDIKTESMGFFEFKNVDRPKEVFAISNSGLTVPDPERLSGKTKDKDFRKEADSNLFKVIKDLWHRKVIIVAMVYLAGLWALVKGADFIVSNYAISPYWPDVLLVFFISFLPSVILHSYYHNKLEIKSLRLVEKITIPSNAILSMALLIFIFGSKNLGATTRTVVSTDEFGNTIEKQIVKSEFRKKLILYPFANESGDSTKNWLEGGLSWMLKMDLVQDDYLWCNSPFREKKSLGAMLKHAESSNTPNFITGKFKKQDGLFVVTSQLYDSKNGHLIQQRILKGENLFDLADEITIQIKRDLGLPASYIQNTKDLPVSSILTDNLEAYRYYHEARKGGSDMFKNRFEADKLDPSFAVNNYEFAAYLDRYNRSHKDAVVAIEKAMKHRSKVTDLYNMRIRTLYYNIHDQPEKAIALREMQSELNPDDVDAYNHLVAEYFDNGFYEKGLQACNKLEDLFPELETELRQAKLLIFLNRADEALPIMESFVKRFPANTSGFQWLGQVHLAMGNLDDAEKAFDIISLMNPDHQGAPGMLEHIQFLREKGDSYNPEMLKQFTGEFKWTRSEMITKITYLEGKIILQTKNQHKHQFYPTSDSTLVHTSLGKETFFRGKDGAFYKLIHEQGGKSEVYKLDESIKKAEKLFSDGDDEGALKAYQEAFLQNPNHYFLNNLVQHLKLKTSKEDRAVISRWQDAVGNYHSYGTITLEEGNLFWWDVEGGLKRQLLPINENEFVLFEKIGYTVSFIEEHGNVVAVNWAYPGLPVNSLSKVD